MLPTDNPSTPDQSPRDRVLDGAIELFATRGYQAIGLRDLAGHVGMKAGSLYHHIESKQALLFELIEATLSDLLFGTRQQLKRAQHPRDALHLFIKAFVSFKRNTPQRIAVMLREQINLDEGQQQEIDALMHAYKGELAAIGAAVNRQKGAPSEQVTLAAEAVVSMLFGDAQWWDSGMNEQQVAELLGRFAYSVLISVPTDAP